MKDNKPPIIHLSFKENYEDINLYNWIISHSNKSGFIKDILKKEMAKELAKNN